MSALDELYRRLHEGDLAAADEIRARAAATGATVVVVSACLLGEKTRYDGGDKHLPHVVDPLLGDPGVIVVPVCPEILGEMGCPRPPVHFDEAGRAVDDRGVDRTAALALGAERGDEIAARAGATRALLKERSPSCGSHEIHGPTGVIAGRGLYAERLARRGLSIECEESPPPRSDVIKR